MIERYRQLQVFCSFFEIQAWFHAQPLWVGKGELHQSFYPHTIRVVHYVGLAILDNTRCTVGTKGYNAQTLVSLRERSEKHAANTSVAT